MKSVAIKSISMRYFKGIVDRTIELDKEGSVIKGANESGKSTVADAVTWILLDRDSLGNTTQSFDIKTRDENGATISGVDHIVRVEFYDGLVLEKKYREKFAGKRGENRRASSHETEYHFNGMSIRKKDYEEKLGEHFTNVQYMQMLTRVHFITEEMNWMEVRNLLFELISEVKKEDVYAEDTELKKIEEIRDGFSIDEALTREKDRLSRVREELNKIPIRLDELNDLLKDPVKPDTEMTEEKVKEAVETAKNVDASNGVNKDRIAELKQERREVITSRDEETDKIMAKAREKAQEIRDGNTDVDERIAKKNAVIRDMKGRVNNLEDKKAEAERFLRGVESYIEKYENAEPKNLPELDDDALVCPTCNQDLPDTDKIVEEHDQKKEDHEEYVREFNEKKAEKLKDQKQKQKEVKKLISDVVLEIKDVKDEIDKEEFAKNELQSEIVSSNSKIVEAKERSREEADAKKAKWNERINAIDHDLEKLENPDPTEEQAERKKWITELEGYLREYEDYRSRVKQNEEINAKIKQHKDRQKELSAQLEEFEFNILLMEKFVMVKSRLIENKINHKFYNVEWRLFEPLVNGGIKETCVPTYKGVAFKEGVNNAHRIIGGIETIKVIGDHLGIHLPVFIDNAESINRIPTELLDGVQVIPMYVTEDPELLIESLDTEVNYVKQ
jgi:chromosome segregation ATPase